MPNTGVRLSVPKVPTIMAPVLPRYTGLPVMTSTSKPVLTPTVGASLAPRQPALNTIPDTTRPPITGPLEPLGKALRMPLQPPGQADEDAELDLDTGGPVAGSEPIPTTFQARSNVSSSLLDVPILDGVSGAVSKAMSGAMSKVSLAGLGGRAKAWGQAALDALGPRLGPYAKPALALAVLLACAMSLSSLLSAVTNVLLVAGALGAAYVLASRRA